MVFLGAPPDAATAVSYRAPAGNYRLTGVPLPVLLNQDFRVTLDTAKFERASVLGNKPPQNTFGLAHVGGDAYVTPEGTPLLDFATLQCHAQYCLFTMNYRGYTIRVSDFKREWLPHWQQVRQYVRTNLDAMLDK